MIALLIRLPDTPIEADPEVPLERLDAAPTVIPLDDVTGNPESVYDHRNLPWPEPKTTPYGGPGHHPQQTPQHQPPQQYSPVYRSPAAPAPVDPYYQDRGGPAMHGGDHFGHPGHADVPHHGGGPPMHHHLAGGGRGGPPGPRGDVGGTWMVSTCRNSMYRLVVLKNNIFFKNKRLEMGRFTPITTLVQ